VKRRNIYHLVLTYLQTNALRHVEHAAIQLMSLRRHLPPFRPAHPRHLHLWKVAAKHVLNICLHLVIILVFVLATMSINIALCVIMVINIQTGICNLVMNHPPFRVPRQCLQKLSMKCVLETRLLLMPDGGNVTRMHQVSAASLLATSVMVTTWVLTSIIATRITMERISRAKFARNAVNAKEVPRAITPERVWSIIRCVVGVFV